jgi:dipeptidyl aminopeptidase/acylaminoacyl peptidase
MNFKGKMTVFFAVLLCLNLFVAASGEKQPLSVETLWKIKRVGSPDLSPDGKWAVVSITSYCMKGDKGDADLWLVSTADGKTRQLTTYKGNEGNARFSPDGKFVAFTSKRGDDTAAQLYIIPTNGGEARRVTDIPTGVSGVKWFGDSKRIAFITRVWPDVEGWKEQGRMLKERKESKITAKVYDSARMKYWDHWIDDREAYVYMVVVKDGVVKPITLQCGRQLPFKNPGGGDYDISPDGKEIAFVSDSGSNPGVRENKDIYVLKIGETEALNITPDNPQSDSNPLYSPDGRFIAFRRKLIKGFYGDRSRIMIHERRAMVIRDLTETFDYGCSSLVWTPDSKRIYFVSDQKGLSRVAYVDLKGVGPRAITSQKSFGSLRIGPRGRMLVAMRQGFSEPPTLVKIIVPRGTVSQLSRFNDPLLAEVQWGEVKNMTYKGAKGESIQMWTILPPGYKEGEKRPLYMLIHGGPHGAINDSFHFRWNAQVFAGWGYICAWPNFHGSSGFGNDFTHSIVGNWADLPYEDVIKGTDYLVEQGLVDPERMVAGGGSYGGYLASLILGKKHSYNALIVHAGVYNLYEMYASDFGTSEKNELAPHYWVDDSFIKNCSPHYLAKHFKTPTLVIHGEKDYRVPIGNGLELFGALQAKGVPSRLVYYPDENHWILKPNNSVFWYNQVKDWLDHWTTH